MGRIALAGRTAGPWAAFEREVLSAPHAGWVKFVGNRRFALRKSPFLDADLSAIYVLPDGAEVEENELVELEVGRRIVRVSALMPSSRAAQEWDSYYVVEAISRPELRLPRPYLEPEDFLARASSDWKGAEGDHLDKAMALQMLSCPESLMGPGGIGSQSFNMSDSERPLDRLKASILRSMPKEFTRRNRLYEFTFIESRDDLSGLRRRISQGQVAEASYNYFKMVDPSAVLLPMQVPTVVYNARCRSVGKDPDPDVVEYLIQALMLRPVVTEEAVTEIERSMSDILESIEPAYARLNVPFDRGAIAKIAMAICRMEGRARMDEASFSRGRGWFREMYRQFSDLRLNYVKAGQEAKLSPWAQTSYGFGALTEKDIKVLAEINRGVYQQGLDKVSFAGLRGALPTMTPDEVRASLERLNLHGHILSWQNGTLFKPVVERDVIAEAAAREADKRKRG